MHVGLFRLRGCNSITGRYLHVCYHGGSGTFEQPFKPHLLTSQLWNVSVTRYCISWSKKTQGKEKNLRCPLDIARKLARKVKRIAFLLITSGAYLCSLDSGGIFFTKSKRNKNTSVNRKNGSSVKNTLNRN